MAYRENKNYVDSAGSSDEEEGPSLRKERRMDNDDPMVGYRAGSKAAEMWTELLAEQSLSETFSGTVGVHGGGDDMVQRGVESYTLPEVRSTDKNDIVRTKYKNRERSSPSDDSEPFDFVADEEKVEETSEQYERRSRGYDYNRSLSRDRGPRNFAGRRRDGEKSGENSASTSRNASWDGRGRQRRQRQKNYDPNKVSDNRHGKPNGNINKGNRSNSNLKRRRVGGDRNPNSVPSDNYSLEALMTTEFPQNIEIGELARRIATALGEREAKYMIRVIIEVGEAKALELFEATREIEASGGMMVANGTRRRTPGGVFMTLFKTDPDVLPVLKEKICRMQKVDGREVRKVFRRMQGKKAETFDDVLKETLELKKLPKASEVLLPKPNSSDVLMDEA